MQKEEKKKSNFKILVVDDSNVSLSFITDSLSKNGYTSIEQTTNPKEAVSFINNDHFHLYILDIVMPIISGLEIAKSITKGEKNSCILMISSLDSENIMLESIISGAKDFLPKPFNKENLINSVDKLYEYAIQAKIF